jgi:hypothetical protein
MRRIFIFGDSHTNALKKALNGYELPDSSVNFDVHWMLSEKNGTVRGDLRYEDALAIVSELTDKDLLVISLLGTGHNIFGLIKHDIPFYFSDTDQCQCDISHNQLIPISLMHDMFIEFCKKNKKIPDLKKATMARVVHLMTPPPKGDNDYIKSKIESYRDKVVAGVHDINPADTRLKLWNIEMDALQVVCRSYDISVLSPPVDAITDAGFLKKEFYGDDATHVNSSYGKLVINKIIDFIGQGG